MTGHALRLRAKYMQYSKFIICFVALSFLCGCAETTIRQHDNFAKNFPKYHSVAIMPGDIFIIRGSKNGQRITVPDAASLNRVMQLATTELSQKGYIITGVISEEDADSDAGEALKDAYSKIISKLYPKKSVGKKKTALPIQRNLGAVATNFAKKSGADMLLVLSYAGEELSQKQVTENFAKDMAIGLATSLVTNGQSAGGGYAHIKDGSAIISLIDGHNGDLLWANMGNDFEDYGTSVWRVMTKKNVMQTAFDKAFKKLPEKGGV